MRSSIPTTAFMRNTGLFFTPKVLMSMSSLHRYPVFPGISQKILNKVDSPDGGVCSGVSIPTRAVSTAVCIVMPAILTSTGASSAGLDFESRIMVKPEALQASGGHLHGSEMGTIAGLLFR